MGTLLAHAYTSRPPNGDPHVRNSHQVRQDYIDFFKARGHEFVRSSPVAPLDDPTLLYTNAGMNQFKDVFLGTGKRNYTRAVNSQKCLRVSGKHNDLEEVGVDTYHHTFFEMLGNWSFGDYFKQDAIVWSWELLTKAWKLPSERIWVTVFGGDEKDGLPADLEAEDIWRSRTNIDPSHILRFGRKDNFWEMGDTGPCGPCTEIHIDRGAKGCDPRDGADRARGVNAGNERFVELWNNVFMQFNRLDNGSLKELPAKHVDTGMGFERVLGVLQGKTSNYDTDLFAPLFEALARHTKDRYGSDPKRDIAFRVIADHARALTVAIADGVLPSNDGRGYVLRRLLRRAARFGRQSLGLERPFVHSLVPSVVEVLGQAFPEIAQRQAHVSLVIQAEEEAFGATLDRGLVVFDQLLEKHRAVPSKQLEGAAAFELYSTYGFPEDLVAQMLRERGWQLDQAGWDRSRAAHREVSRSEGRFKQSLSAELLAGLPPTKSTYHAGDASALELVTKSCLVHLQATSAKGEAQYAVVLEESPFYAESGGQVADVGDLVEVGGSWDFRVSQVTRLGGVLVHLGEFTRGGPGRAGQSVRARVDRARRELSKKNHTATHLLQRALKEVLGSHVAQQGSYVGPDRLRFDFSHPKGVEAKDLERIEALVNEKIGENPVVRTTIEDLDQAKARGVLAMFGEKYESQVRVLDVGGWSMELCGGTHVRAAGEIGPFVITMERAVAAGVRRIEALTGPSALAFVQAQRRALQDAAQRLKAAPEDLGARIEQLQEELKESRKKTAQAAKADVGAVFARLEAALEQQSLVHFAVLDLPELDLEGLGELAARAKAKTKDLTLVLFGREGEKPAVIAACEGAALTKGLKAGELAGSLAKMLGGGGGGRPNLAQGQGTDPSQIPAALARGREILLEKLRS